MPGLSREFQRALDAGSPEFSRTIGRENPSSFFRPSGRTVHCLRTYHAYSPCHLPFRCKEAGHQRRVDPFRNHSEYSKPKTLTNTRPGLHLRYGSSYRWAFQCKISSVPPPRCKLCLPGLGWAPVPGGNLVPFSISYDVQGTHQRRYSS